MACRKDGKGRVLRKGEGYAPFFWQAIQIRYPEYATYNRELYALFGGAD